MLEDGRCDLCGSDITCACGQYSSVADRKFERLLGRMKQILEALATDGFPCPPEMQSEAQDLLKLWSE